LLNLLEVLENCWRLLKLLEFPEASVVGKAAGGEVPEISL
jgi:hypothetical protein